MNLRADQIIDSYRVERKLGHGGMGAVYLAVHQKIERRVAIKVLHAHYAQDPEMAQRFLNEARAVNIVQHPSLVAVSDYGQLDDGSTYIVMEYLEGETLGAWIGRAGGRLAEAELMQIGAQVAHALSAAHDRGIIHRDLKPDNLMIVSDPAAASGQRVKILDFGIAKVAQGSGPGGVHTQTSAVMGTPTYMAPEQCLGAGRVDDRADVYALGAIFYHALAGAPMFARQGLGELILAHINEAPRPLREAAPGVSEAMAELVHGMLAKAPGQRPSMVEVLERLRTFGAAVTAVPRSTGARTAPEGPGGQTPELGTEPTMDAAKGPASGAPPGSAAGFGGSAGTLQPVPGRTRPARSRGVGRALLAAGGVLGVGALVAGLYFGGGLNGPAPEDRPAAQPVPPGGPAPSPVVPPEVTDNTCSPAGLCAEVPVPGVKRLRRVFAASSHEAWAVGDPGVILHHDGHTWRGMNSGTSARLPGLWGFGRKDMWAVGDEGTILRYSGRNWQAVPGAGTASLIGLFGPTADDLWAVGKGGVILHRTAEGWRHYPPVTDQTLYTVWGSGPADIFAVGAQGVILRYDGAAWVRMDVGTTRALYAIWGSGPRDVWAVGQGGTILHYDGAAWSMVPSGVQVELSGIWGGGGEVWAVGGQGTVLRHDGATWARVESGITQSLNDVVVPAPGRLWAVGMGGLILRRQQAR